MPHILLSRRYLQKSKQTVDQILIRECECQGGVVTRDKHHVTSAAAISSAISDFSDDHC